MPEKDSRHFFNLTNVAAVVSISVPFLYIIGHLYFQGYLSVYNQSVDSLSLPFESILMKSFYVVSGSLFHLVGLIIGNIWHVLLCAGAMFLYVLVIVFLSNRYEKIETEVQKRKIGLKESKIFNYGFIPTAVAIFSVGAPIFLLVLIASIFMLIWSSHSYGAKLAKEEIEDFAYCKEGQKAVCTIVVESSGNSTTGVLIASTDKYVALYTGQKVVLISNQNLKIETQPKK
ncbi:hypothetical protein [Pseudoalteromonas ruthenica]|uniref:hypothetical protein n=1 Tax=Pseudoalteromonas ruthenica TaxID=151081 RepID=UPI00034A6C88|nr:hypothetical protein [Pseudoalteromonas ruthenica]